MSRNYTDDAPLTIAFYLFRDAEELDFVGPWEVFTACTELKLPVRAFTVAEQAGLVRCHKGLQVLAEYGFDDMPPADILLIPGGEGTRGVNRNETAIDWVRQTAENCDRVATVCTGSSVAAKAGLADGKRITTHWSAFDILKKAGPKSIPTPGERVIDEGTLITAAGVSAGIDMALTVVGQIWTPEHARTVQKFIEYYPDPPYQT